MARKQVRGPSLPTPVREPPPTMTVRAGQLKRGMSKMRVNQRVTLQVTGKVVEDSIETYSPNRPRQFRVEVSRVTMPSSRRKR